MSNPVDLLCIICNVSKTLFDPFFLCLLLVVEVGGLSTNPPRDAQPQGHVANVPDIIKGSSLMLTET